MSTRPSTRREPWCAASSLMRCCKTVVSSTAPPRHAKPAGCAAGRAILAQVDATITPPGPHQDRPWQAAVDAPAVVREEPQHRDRCRVAPAVVGAQFPTTAVRLLPAADPQKPPLT